MSPRSSSSGPTSPSARCCAMCHWRRLSSRSCAPASSPSPSAKATRRRPGTRPARHAYSAPTAAIATRAPTEGPYPFAADSARKAACRVPGDGPPLRARVRARPRGLRRREAERPRPAQQLASSPSPGDAHQGHGGRIFRRRARNYAARPDSDRDDPHRRLPRVESRRDGERPAVHYPVSGLAADGQRTFGVGPGPVDVPEGE